MDAVADALGSLRASGLHPGDDVRRLAVAWADGRLSSARLRSVERALVSGEDLGPFVAAAEGHDAPPGAETAGTRPPPGEGSEAAPTSADPAAAGRSGDAPAEGPKAAAPDPGGARPNIAGLRDPAALVRLEADLVHLRLAQLAIREVPGTFDLRHLGRIHLRLLGALYWSAGDLRTAPVRRRGRPSCAPEELRARTEAALSGLERGTALRALPAGRVLDRAAAVLAALDALLPFAVGNGCAARAFVGAWASAAGHRIAWRHLDPATALLAADAAAAGSTGPLRHALEPLLRPVGSGAPRPADTD